MKESISNKNYIPALDGLRALSIMLVIIFHINENYLSGGFIGVDIFFVISGYIITKNIMSENSKKKFHFRMFYLRRIMRLMPAAAITAIITYILSFYVFGSERTSELTWSFITSTFWSSNIYYFLNIGYFDPISSSNPFLHYWSLSVEEQFYLIWPFLIVIIIGIKLYRYILLYLISIIFAAYIYYNDPEAMFYLTPARVFQFAAGALISCVHHYRQEHLDRLNIAGAIFGLAALGIITVSAIYASGEEYNFIIAAVGPTVGASLFILFVNTLPLTRTMGASWLTWTGKRAYSLYLVHWPIMVFASFYLGPNRTLFVDSLIILACFAAADFLYHQVETPFRRIGRTPTGRSGRLIAVGIVSVGAISIGALSFWYFHVPIALRDSVAQHTTLPTSEPISAPAVVTEESSTPGSDEFEDNNYTRLADQISARRYESGRVRRGCHLEYNAPIEEFLADACMPELPPGPKVILIGDSYGAETIPLLETWLPPDRLITAVSGGCLPIYPEPGIASRPASCQEINRYRYRQLESREDVTAVVLVSNWRHWRQANIESTIEFITSLGKQVFIVGARPQFSESIPNLLDSPLGSQVYEDLSRYHLYDPYEKNELLREVASRFDNVHFIDILPSFCSDVCPAFFGDQELIYMDAAHTGPEFAQVIARHVEQSQPGVINALQASIAHEDSPEPMRASSLPAVLSLRLECDAINAELPSATRMFEATFTAGNLTMQIGTTADARYERWDGLIEGDGRISIQGEYIEGEGGIKPVHLEGNYNPGGVSATGTRGIRRCDLFID